MGSFLQTLDNFFNAGTGFLFGPIMLVVFFGTGILMTIVTRGVQFRKFGAAIREVFGKKKKKETGDGELRPFQALATALSSCVGNGNVVGVSAALVSGGPGAIFWMWIAAITGMATKYSEILLAMHFREKDDRGIWRGGLGRCDRYHYQNSHLQGSNKRHFLQRGWCRRSPACARNIGYRSPCQTESVWNS